MLTCSRLFSLCFSFRMLKHKVKRGRVGHKLLILQFIRFKDQGCVQQCTGFAHFSGSPGRGEGQLGMGAKGGLAPGLRSCLNKQAAHLLCPQTSPAHQGQSGPWLLTAFWGKRGENGCFVSSLRDPVLLIAQQQEELPRASTAGVIFPLFSCPGLGRELGKLPFCWLWWGLWELLHQFYHCNQLPSLHNVLMSQNCLVC